LVRGEPFAGSIPAVSTPLALRLIGDAPGGRLIALRALKQCGPWASVSRISRSRSCQKAGSGIGRLRTFLKAFGETVAGVLQSAEAG
jgi:hypothetical protein